MRKALLVNLICAFGFNTIAQNIQRCGHDLYIQQRANTDSTYLNTRSEIDQLISDHARHNSNRSGEIYRIPVVFHVIYNSAEQNLPDSKIQEQLDILNRDYGRLNEDTVNTRSEFLPVAGSTGIEFYLAQWDPQGNSTTGITHTQTDRATFFNLQFDLNLMKSASTDGVDAWDVNHYLNIWVCNLSVPILNTPIILGFATPPDGAPNWPTGSAAEQPQYDGVVLHYEIVGENPNATGTFATINKGRTATHEVGHYLGLRHIWGDGQGQDGCSVDDGIEDTPNCADAQQQTCDYTSNTCTDSPIDFPDQIENYMDYSDENCMNMFTNQQANAMRFVVENFRQDLLLSTPTLNSTNLQLGIFPNPSARYVHLKFPTENLEKVVKIQILDIDGRVVKTLSAGNQDIDIMDLHSGIYMLKVQYQSSFSCGRFVKL
jgi:hypothetical protein